MEEEELSLILLSGTYQYSSNIDFVDMTSQQVLYDDA